MRFIGQTVAPGLLGAACALTFGACGNDVQQSATDAGGGKGGAGNGASSGNPECPLVQLQLGAPGAWTLPTDDIGPEGGIGGDGEGSGQGHSGGEGQSGGAGGEPGIPEARCESSVGDGYLLSGTTTCRGEGLWEKDAATGHYRIALQGEDHLAYTPADDLKIAVEEGERVEFEVTQTVTSANPFHSHTQTSWRVRRARDAQVALEGWSGGGSFEGTSVAETLGVTVDPLLQCSVTKAECDGSVLRKAYGLQLGDADGTLVSFGQASTLDLAAGTFALAWAQETAEVLEASACPDSNGPTTQDFFELRLLEE